MKKLSLAIMLIAQTSLANADFKTLGDRLSSDSILFKTCVDVQSKIQSQTEFNQSERERLLVALKSPGSDKSDNEADLEAAEQELIRLSIEAPKVTLIAGAISDSMAVSLDVNCNTAELEFVVTRYTDAAST
ncbi:MAG: hypothetical protein KDD37_11835, partial [Bdellovibrionales bacterium]|nr:hypothetical protein [Bdellovibrionales bacterium]